MLNVTIKLDRTPVPNTETNYYCQSFELPRDRVYHLVGSEPLLDNEDVIHHQILFGCADSGNTRCSSILRSVYIMCLS